MVAAAGLRNVRPAPLDIDEADTSDRPFGAGRVFGSAPFFASSRDSRGTGQLPLPSSRGARRLRPRGWRLTVTIGPDGSREHRARLRHGHRRRGVRGAGGVPLARRRRDAAVVRSVRALLRRPEPARFPAGGGAGRSSARGASLRQGDGHLLAAGARPDLPGADPGVRIVVAVPPAGTGLVRAGAGVHDVRPRGRRRGGELRQRDLHHRAPGGDPRALRVVGPAPNPRSAGPDDRVHGLRGRFAPRRAGQLRPAAVVPPGSATTASASSSSRSGT